MCRACCIPGSVSLSRWTCVVNNSANVSIRTLCHCSLQCTSLQAAAHSSIHGQFHSMISIIHRSNSLSCNGGGVSPVIQRSCLEVVHCISGELIVAEMSAHTL